MVLACAVAALALAGCLQFHWRRTAATTRRPGQDAGPRRSTTGTGPLVAARPRRLVLIGNPNARVKLSNIWVDRLAALPDFDEAGAARLRGDYVKCGKVSWEFRPYVRPTDSIFMLLLNLIARCGGPQTLLPADEHAV